MKKMTIVALSIFALANLSCYVGAEEVAAPVTQTEQPQEATAQKNTQDSKATTGKEHKGKSTEKTEKTALPTKKTNEEAGKRGIKLPTQSSAPEEKTKSHDNCSCDPSATDYCGRDAC